MDQERQPNDLVVKKVQDRQVYGKYLNYTRRVFTVSEILHIKATIMRGTRIARIAARYGVDAKVIDRLFVEFIKNPKGSGSTVRQCRLGHKDEPYYETEEEMLERPTYSWEELSILEKEWYLQRTGTPGSLYQ